MTVGALIYGVTDETQIYLDKMYKLWDRLDRRHRKYRIYGFFHEGDGQPFFVDKTGLIKGITDEIGLIDEYYIPTFSGLDYTLTPDAKLDLKTKEVKSMQQTITSCFPGKTYAQVQKSAVSSFKRLKKDCLAFIEEIKNVPEEILPTELPERKQHSK